MECTTTTTATLKERMHTLQALHGLFIGTLLCTGVVGLGLFGHIIAQPIRSCPVIYAIYTTFWLAIGLSVLQVILALVFLVWFVVILCASGKPTGSQQRLNLSPSHDTMTPRTVVEALGQPRGGGGGTGGQSLSRTRQAYTTSPAHMATSPATSRLSLRSGSHSRTCHPKVGWLCLGGIFLALLSAGLILCLVLVVNYINYLDKSFIAEFTNVFIEAQVNFNGEQSTNPNDEYRPNNAFVCWNIVQSNYHCCGLTNYTDWFSANSNSTSVLSSLPESCYCVDSCTPSKVYTVEGRLVYTAGCNALVHEVFTFKLHSSRLYFALTLALLLAAFLVDLIYTLYTAYVTLSLSYNTPSMNGLRISPDSDRSAIAMPRLHTTPLTEGTNTTPSSDLSVVSVR